MGNALSPITTTGLACGTKRRTEVWQVSISVGVEEQKHRTVEQCGKRRLLDQQPKLSTAGRSGVAAVTGLGMNLSLGSSL